MSVAFASTRKGAEPGLSDWTADILKNSSEHIHEHLAVVKMPFYFSSCWPSYDDERFKMWNERSTTILKRTKADQVHLL